MTEKLKSEQSVNKSLPGKALKMHANDKLLRHNETLMLRNVMSREINPTAALLNVI